LCIDFVLNVAFLFYECHVHLSWMLGPSFVNGTFIFPWICGSSFRERDVHFPWNTEFIFSWMLRSYFREYFLHPFVNMAFILSWMLYSSFREYGVHLPWIRRSFFMNACFILSWMRGSYFREYLGDSSAVEVWRAGDSGWCQEIFGCGHNKRTELQLVRHCGSHKSPITSMKTG
jgi:hypothetical protein